MDDICSMKNIMNMSLELWVGQGAGAPCWVLYLFFILLFILFQVIGIQFIYIQLINVGKYCWYRRF
jgi:hypothetical protein